MELRDYIAALRRYWPTWVGLALAGLLVALAVVQLSPHTYRATAQVFVSSSAQGGGSPQFVSQRVKSYPEVAISAAVLDPAGEELGLDAGARQLRSRVSASNPADTSQINIVATSDDPDRAAAIANAVAEQFTGVVEELEQPASGGSPVSLTITNPATAPSSPASPQAAYLLVLGLVVGLFLGLATSVVRSRLDTSLRGEADVRRAWGPGAQLPVLVERSARRHRSRLSGHPAATLARRMEALAGDRAGSGGARVGFLSPAPDQRPAAQALASAVADRLAAAGAVPAHIAVLDPLAPLRVWREVASGTDGVVLVVPSGRVAAADLSELRTILEDTHVQPLAVVVTRRTRRAVRQRTSGGTTPELLTARPGPDAVLPVPVPLAAATPPR